MSFFILHGIRINQEITSEIVGIYDDEYIAGFMFSKLIQSTHFNTNFLTLHITCVEILSEVENFVEGLEAWK